MELKSSEKRKLNLGKDLFGESGLYILEGKIFSDGNTYGSKQILIAKDHKLCEFEMDKNTTIYILGGEPFKEERHIQWNFVASDKNFMKQARNNWKNQNFPIVPGETGFVPLPN
ncbi:pirin-like cupin domain-containing protein [Salegentibacter sp. 24]|nr:pirin-like cupin domain-containing protein [Salegentibacter sp. 24]